MCKKSAVYTMSQLSIQMQTMYTKFNEHCFGGILPGAVISFEQGKKKRAYGWTYSEKMWKQGGQYKYSIVIATEWLDDLDNVLITLLHEMCHLYAMEKGIKDTSRSGYYHNDCFKLIAEQAGLICTKETQGWATRSMADSLREWIEHNCPVRDIRLVWGHAPKMPEPEKPKEEGESGGGAEPEKPKKKNGFYVWKCPECGLTVRSTKLLKVACFGTDAAEHDMKMMDIQQD